jgi:hypothetical protein
VSHSSVDAMSRTTTLTIVQNLAIIVSLRIYTRAFIVRNIGKDDLSMVTALVFTLGYLATILVLRGNGVGFSGKFLTLNQMTTTIKVIIGIEILYYLCVNAIKISILFFYLRIGKTGRTIVRDEDTDISVQLSRKRSSAYAKALFTSSQPSAQ